eukprot:CAMPEP_0201910686 /NCGR_PEP_ID=MMETSP0903-20130614/1970_1 /ASSEMBLY_ACC=CAM_ASM_000552 /TAXON_ID=420261 /ORGANISM="Thalassiosira antarctica, Strain CCMP982" /LENGTH=592 /DNA_ID=CAMNT_0048445357 /DNA_START=5 /DNA_END=1783 /DNA_ORIENTATION=-
MALSVDTVGNGAKCDENESPLGKRKSELISPSSRRTTTTSSIAQAQHHRGPLFDVNSNPEKASSATTATPSKPHRSTPPTPTRTSLPPPYSANKFNSTNNKFKLPSSRQQHVAVPSKDEIQATDEKQASVNQLSEWLATESARKKKKPPMHRPLSSSSPTPLRFLAKPLHKKSDVQATNSKAASVKTLSSWMNDGDPFSQKKVRTIRSGHKVIAKSRIFEKEGASIIVRKECDIRAGSVRGKSAWLSEAFKSEGGEEKLPQPLMEKKIRPYQCKPKESTPVKELKSVRDKKEWLSNAFKKGGEKEAQQQLQHSIIHQTKSFDVNNDATTPGIRKCASTDDGTTHHIMIQQTKSCDGMRPPPSSASVTSSSSERQHNVVRLYQSTPKKGEDEKSPEETLKTVHDKQAWLSSAFKKPISGSATTVNGKEDAEEKILMEAPLIIEKEKSVDEKSLDKPVVRATKTNETVSDGSEKDKLSVADRAKWDRAKWPYKKGEEKSAEKTSKTVHDKQAWSSSALKKQSGSATANGKEEDTEEKKLIEAPLNNIVKKSVDEKSLAKHVVEATKTKLAVSDASERDKMSVADRAKWLRGAFK